MLFVARESQVLGGDATRLTHADTRVATDSQPRCPKFPKSATEIYQAVALHIGTDLFRKVVNNNNNGL